MELKNLFNNRSKMATIGVLAIFVIIIALILLFGGRGSDENAALSGQISETLNLASDDATDSAATGTGTLSLNEPVPLAIEEPAIIIADAQPATESEGAVGDNPFDFIYDAEPADNAIGSDLDFAANPADPNGGAFNPAEPLDFVANVSDSDGGIDPFGSDLILKDAEPLLGGGEGEGGGSAFKFEAIDVIAAPPEKKCNSLADCNDPVLVNPDPEPEEEPLDAELNFPDPEPEEEPLDAELNLPEDEPLDEPEEAVVPEEEIIPEEVPEEEVVPLPEPEPAPEVQTAVVQEAQPVLRPAASKPPTLSKSGPTDLLFLLSFAALTSLGYRRLHLKKNQ